MRSKKKPQQYDTPEGGVLFRPSSKRQEQFINSKAFITCFGGAAMSGKAQPLYSKVLTNTGWKKMGDIQVGDEVITPKNSTSKVLSVYPHTNKNIYEITTKSGVTVRACDEHLWKVDVAKPKYKSKTEVSNTSKLIEHIEKGYKVFLPQCDAIGSSEDYELPIDPYVLGVLIAEGGLTTGKPIFTNDDVELVARVAKWCDEKGYKINPTKDGRTHRIVSKDFDASARNNKGQFIKSNKLVSVLSDLGLAFTSSYTKFIPESYLHNASISQRFELLKGLMDSDGTISESLTCEYSTSSDKLKDDVCYLVRSLGGIARVTSRYPTYTYKGEKKTGALNHRVWIRFKNTEDIFYISRKKSKCRVRKQPVRDKIVSIKYIGKEDAKCIYIDSEDHLYLTDDFVVTHNTYQGLMRFLLYVDEPSFSGYVVRKNATDFKKGGGAFEEAIRMFTAYDSGMTYTKQPMQITFSSGATINFIGLDGASGMDSVQGIQITCAMVDESTHLTEEEIMWLITRLRATTDTIEPCIWLTCNPDPESFLCSWLSDYYLYPIGSNVDDELVEGRPITERNGNVRYFLRIGNDMKWASSYEELFDEYKDLYPLNHNGVSTCRPQSFCFIGATCLDNPIMLEKNPNYVAQLASAPRIKMERLLKGNWFAREEGSGYFKRDWTPVQPSHDLFSKNEVVKRVRAWDLASTLPSESYPNPDYTVGVLIARTKSGYYIVEDMVRGRWRAGELEKMLVEQTQKDIEMYGYGCVNYLPIEPASAGKIQKHHFSRVFAEERTPIKFFKVGSGKSKLDRFLPFASVAENGLVIIKEDDWNNDLFFELEAFTGSRSKVHDDIVDAASDAYNLIATSKELPKINARLLKMN